MPNNLKRYAINQSPFFKLKNKKRLARLLKIDLRELRSLAKNANNFYEEFAVKKKDGGSRNVENPARKLKVAQATLARFLGRINPPDYLFCPVKGRSYVSNAARHRGNRVVHCLDIRKYFPSTPSRRVYWFFKNILQCDPDIASILANITCYMGHLPTGSPSSPILAYFAHYDVWENINAICLSEGYVLTVYIDDVTISAAKIDPKVIWSIKEAIHSSGLRYHKEKSYYDNLAEITGVIVNGETLVVPRRQLKKIADSKAALKLPLEEKEENRIKARLAGLNAQVGHVLLQKSA